MPSRLFYDQLIRHQIYLEGYKAFQGGQFNAYAKQLEQAFRMELASLDFDKFNEISRPKLNAAIKRLRKRQMQIHAAYQKKIADDLKKFAKADYKLLADIAEKPTTLAKELIDRIMVNPIPGVGLPTAKFLQDQSTASIVEIEKLLNQAKSNGWTRAELLERVLGKVVKEPVSAVAKPPLVSTAERLRTSVKSKELAKVKAAADTDGVKLQVPTANTVGRQGGALNKARSQAQAAMNTALQHISSELAADVVKSVSDEYQWVSVIDSATSDICRERNLKIYSHGEGPLPPAHINCRSHIVPYVRDEV